MTLGQLAIRHSLSLSDGLDCDLLGAVGSQIMRARARFIEENERTATVAGSVSPVERD